MEQVSACLSLHRWKWRSRGCREQRAGCEGWGGEAIARRKQEKDLMKHGSELCAVYLCWFVLV